MASSEWLVSAEAGPPWLYGFVGPASPSGFDTVIFTRAVLGFSNDCLLKSICVFSEDKSVEICFYDSGSLQIVVDAFILGLLLPLMLAASRFDTTL